MLELGSESAVVAWYRTPRRGRRHLWSACRRLRALRALISMTPKFVYFVIDKTDNDTDLSHFFLQSWTTACASSFQSSSCNSDIFRIQKKNNWRTNTMNFVFRLEFLSPSLENTQNTKAHRNQKQIQNTGVCGQGLSYVFAAPPIKYFVIFLRLSIANPNPNPNLKP